MCFFKVNTLWDISQEWLVRLTWNEKELHQFDTGSNMWPWPLTPPMSLILNFLNSCFEISLFQELLVWLTWNQNEWFDWILRQLCHIPVWPNRWYWPWISKFVIALSQEGEGRLTWDESNVSWSFMTMTLTFVWPRWVRWMYLIMNRVTFDVGVLSKHLVAYTYKEEFYYSSIPTL